MGSKNKLKRFKENETFKNVFQPSRADLVEGDYKLKGNWRQEFFKNDNPLVLELGCGKGEYSVELAKKYPNITYDYIYIDGDHSYKGVVDDCIYFLPRLSKGGYLSFHDISVKGKRPDGIYGVWKVWSKLISDFKGIEIQYVGSGLGIIQK